MSQPVTVLSLLSGSRNLADCMGNPFITDTELVDRGDRACKLLHGMLVERLESKYKYSTYDFTTVSGQESYAAPPDLYKPYGLDMWPASGTSGVYVSLRPYNFRHRDRRQLNGPYDWRSGVPVPGYDLRGDTLYLTPAPASARTVRVHYAPVATTLTGSLQTFDGVEGWDDFVVCHMARYALTKQEKSTSVVDGMLKEAEARVEKHCQFRDAGEPEALEDDDGSWGW